MTRRHPINSDHQLAWELLPWLINDTLPEMQRSLVEEHLSNCLVCRRELAEQKRMRHLIRSRQDTLMSPGEAFSHLQQKLDDMSKSDSNFKLLLRRRMVWTTAVAATATLAIVLWVISGNAPTLNNEPRFRTLTSEQSVGNAHVQISFAADVSVDDRREIVASIDGLIVSEAGSTGVYNVKLVPSPSADDLVLILKQLKSDQRVEFAGPVYGNGVSLD